MLGQEKPQDFELVELLIREAGSNVGSSPSTSTQQGNDFGSFKARFQSYIDQVPSYLHSVGKEGFFPHFFLGSFSTLIDIEIAKKLDIEKIYFSFDSSKTLKVAVIKEGEIKSPEDAADKVKLFVIAESGSTKKKFSYGELDKILGNTKVARNNVVRLARDQSKLGVRLVEITQEKDAKGKIAGIFVNVESNKLDNDASTIHEFKEIKKGLWNNPESDIAKLTNPDVEKVKKPVENILKKVSKIHSEYKDSLIYGKEVREAAHHGFIAGALVNFRYRHNLRVYLEQFAGRGYADIVLVPRGKDRSLNAVPIIIELKAGTAAGTTPDSALEQAKDYAKGFQPNTIRVLTISDNVLCVGLNLDSTEGEKFSMHISPPREREPAPPTIQKLLEVTSSWNGERSTITDITEKIKQPLDRIYHTFPGTSEKGGNYFSRFLLGQLLLADKFVDIDLEKSVFLYNEYPLASSTRSGAQSTERPVTTFMLTKGNQGQNKEVFVFHIREGGKGGFSEKKIPINLPAVGKITEVCISLQKERESDFFDVEKVNRYNSLNEYKQGKSFFGGEWKNIPYPAELKETFDKTLESQHIPQSSSTAPDSDKLNKAFGNYKGLLEKIGEGILPLKPLIKREAHFQAVLHGAFNYYSDIKLGELQENRALVLIEFQTGRGKRIDMVVHGIQSTEVASNAEEYITIGMEIKGPREGKGAVGLLKEADNQIEKEYKEGTTYKTLTDGDKVFIMGVMFDNKAQSSNSLIKITDKLFPVNVIHSSKVKGDINKLKRPARHKLFNRELNALRSFKVHYGGTITNWADIKRDRLQDSNKDFVDDSPNTFSKSGHDFQSYLDRIPENVGALDLSEMGLDGSKVKILSNFLSKLKNINSIDLSYNEFNSVQVSGLINSLIENNHKVPFLDLSENNIGSNGGGPEAIESLARFIETNNIDNLVISGIEMTSNDLSKIFQALKKNTSIKSLDCSSNKVVAGFNKDDVKTIVDLLYSQQKLTALNLANTGMNDRIIKDIEEKAQKDYQGKILFIEELDIGNYNAEGKGITKEGIKSLAKLLKQVSKLKSLRLSGNPIGVEGLKELVSALKIRNTDIETLDISEISLECNQDNAESIADIMKSLIGELNIRELSLAGNQLNAKAIGEIFSSMKNREEQVLKELDLAGNSIGDEIDYKTLEAISSSLKDNDVLESLNLANIDLSTADIEEILGALRKETIVNLDISGNDISGSTMQELSEFLQDNSVLRFLNIANYDRERVLLPEGIGELFLTLKDRNKVLTHLNIGDYAFSDESVNIVAKHLGSNIGIQYLSLANSEFTGDQEQALNVLFEALKKSNLQFLDARGISITDRVIDKIIECLKVNENLQVLHISQNKLSKNQVERLERASLKTSVQVEPRFSANSGCPQRVKREIGNILCVDSRDEEKITEEEKEQRIKELFNADKVVEKVKNIEFYDQLFRVSRQISKGEIINKNVEEAFVARVKGIDLNSIDPEIRDIVKEIKDNVENKEEIKNILRRSGVAEKIGKVAEGAGLAFTAFLVGKHIANGDIEGLGYDALNLWIMPKIGEKISGKMLELGTKFDSQMLKGFAPVMGRAIGNYAAFLGLAESIKARQSATDPVDIKIADLNIATNSIFIAADVPAVVTETMSAIGMEAGIIGEFAGPVGGAVSAAVIIISQFVEAELEVEKLEEHIKLTDQEKHDLYWDLFLGKKVPHYIEDNMEVKEIYKQYISKIIDKFKNDYFRIAISLPPISVKKMEYATNNQLRQKKRGIADDIDNQIKHLFDACRIGTKVVDREFDFNFTATMSSSNTRYTGHYSRMVPHSFENYNIVCGPYGDNIKEQEISRETWHKLPSEALCNDSSPHKGKILSTVKEKWSLQEYSPHCQNVVVYEGESSNKYKTDIYYIKSLYTDIRISEKDSLNVIFFGTHASISDLSERGSDKVENRYYFIESLESCDVQKSGSNFFYIEDDRFFCNLGINKQKNIVIVKGDFIDSKNIHSIIGSNEANHIEVSHAGYVDGKGGNDVIMVKSFTTIKGYFGDSIHGKGLVLLPINFSDIGSMTHANNITNIYNKSGDFISVDKQTSVKTADGLFVTPTKIDDKAGVVTNLHVTKSLRGDVVLDDELDNLRKIDNSNFNITKQLSSANYHSTIGSSSNHIFYPDKEHHNFYWEAPSNISHLYLFDNRNANITIAQANGILDFSQLNSTLSDMPFIENNEGKIKINKNDLHITLLPDYKDVTVTFDGEEYYKFQNGELERDYCSHSLKIDGRFNVNGTDLLNHHNCFTFDSDKVLFWKLNNDLLLLSDKGALSISGYYSSVHKSWDLSIGLNNKIMEPEEFRERADDFSSFRYYQPDEQGLQIYHNQPINKNDIGLVDLKGKSILDFDMKVMNDTLLLSHKNNTLVKVENWNTYQPARKMMFAFNDTMVSNSKCIVSTCNSEDITADFNNYVSIIKILKQAQLDRELLIAVQDGNFNKVTSLVNQNAGVNTNDEYGWTPLHFAASGNKFDIVEFLFDNNATIKATDVYGNTPLHVAAQYSSKLEIVEFLLDKDASGINNITNNGWTPLHVAVQGNKPNTVKFFLNRKASIGVQDKYGITPLGLAVQKGYTNIVQMIEQAQLNLEKELLTAAQDGNLNKVKDLIIQGANLSAQNEPLDIARDKGYSDIVEYLERKLNEKEEKPTQRKRRHHHGDHNRHHNHLSRKPLAIDSSNQPEIAASSGTRPSSWINGLFGWVKGFVGGLFYSRAALSEEASNTASAIPQVDEQFAKASVSNSSSTSTTLPSDGTDKKQENGDFFRDNIDYVNANIKQMRERQTPVKFKPSGGNTILEMGDHYLSHVDFYGTIMLLDLLIRKVTGQKYIFTVDQSISPLEAQGYALNITKEFEKVVEQAAKDSKISMHRLSIDFVKIQKEVTGKIMGGKFNEILGILNSYVGRACPGREAGYLGKLSPKKFDKFILEFNSRLNVVLDQPMQQMLHNGNSRVGASDEKINSGPRSYLNNASIQSHLTQDKVKLIS